MTSPTLWCGIRIFYDFDHGWDDRHKSLILVINMPILAHKTATVSPDMSGFFTLSSIARNSLIYKFFCDVFAGGGPVTVMIFYNFAHRWLRGMAWVVANRSWNCPCKTMG